LAGLSVAGANQKFYADDPLLKEPETEDAAKVQEWDIVLSYDLLQNLFARPGDTQRARAGNLNSIDEVPDSNWFTNRILARPLSIADAVRGPLTGPAPARGQWTLIRTKSSGVSPGFVARDSAGMTWFVQFDAPGHNEAASAASMVANKIFHALGYWQTENFIAEVRPEAIAIAEQTKIKTPSGKTRQFTRADLAEILSRAAKQPDGSYRLLASRALSGRPVGGFKYNGTRPDDPNDIVPHEHRRELRALQVFGAWANLVDMKAGNTLDVVIPANGKSVVRHYLQDVGSTFGTGALGPRDWDEGYEYLYEGDQVWKRLVSFGFYRKPWQTVPYQEHDSIGRFEGEQFDPRKWKPRVPTAAILHARPDDEFWAARRVMAFSDEMIRAVVKTGQFSDAAAERHLADVLIQRRDRIGRAFLPAVNPIVSPSLGRDGVLTFSNAATDARVADAPSRYQAVWSRFDNVTRTSARIGETSGTTPRLQAPTGLPTAAGGYLHVEIAATAAANPTWATPVHAYFKRVDGDWRLIGFERLE
ncbi:MAG: hypothetical protein ABI652_04400, partial [Acidobacteriota bacterium]